MKHYLYLSLIVTYLLTLLALEVRNESNFSSLKGGDPTAGSPTVTLLRLHPSR